MDWSTFASAVLSSAVLSSLVSSALDARSSRTQAREERHTPNVDAARDALAPLRTAYQQAGQAGRTGPDHGRDGAVVLDGAGAAGGAGGAGGAVDGLIALENEFDAAIGKCDSETVRAASQRYKEVARAYAANDPDTGKAREEEAYQALQSSLNARTKRFRPKK